MRVKYLSRSGRVGGAERALAIVAAARFGQHLLVDVAGENLERGAVVVAGLADSSMAIEYGSSPDEQPADQMRIFLTVLRSRISGTISSANAASCAGSRKK